jgi:hypothetical protein
MQRGRGGGPAVACVIGHAVARQRGDRSSGVDLPDPVVVGVGDEEVARAVDRDAVRLVQSGIRGEAAVASVVVPAGVGRDDVGRIDAAYSMVSGVRDVDVAVAV